MAAKRVELLKAVVPKLSQLALLAPPESQGSVVTESVSAGKLLGVQVVMMSVRNPADVDRAFAAMPAARVQGSSSIFPCGSTMPRSCNRPCGAGCRRFRPSGSSSTRVA